MSSPLYRNILPLLCLLASTGALAQAPEETESPAPTPPPPLPSQVKDPLFNNLARAPEIDTPSDKWNGSFGLGITLQQGSTNSSQGSMTLDAVRTTANRRLLANVIAVRGTENGERDTDNINADFRSERSFGQDMFGYLALGAERDGVQELQSRGSAGGGLGSHLFASDTLSFNAYIGIAYSEERYRGEAASRGIEGLLGSELRYDISEHSRFTHRLVVYPDSVSGGTRFAMQGALSTRINSTLGLQVAMLQKYREKVRGDATNLDTIVFTGITAGF